MKKLTDLPNIGNHTAGLLTQSGIQTPEDLRALGAKEAFLRIRMVDSGACIRVLYGLQGAIDGVRDSDLSPSVKEELKTFYNSL